MNIMMLGAPGAGKGTQAELISKQFSIPGISTGVMLRKAVADETPAGLAMKKYMDAGSLVPDEVVLDILEERLAQPDCKGGFILDGVPRNIAQAETLERKGLVLNHVLLLNTPDEVITARIVGRRSCSKCGVLYHIENFPPQREGICDHCGGELIRRSDDEPEKVINRLKVYHDETEPLVAFYTERNLVRNIPYSNSPGEVFSSILRELRK